MLRRGAASLGKVRRGKESEIIMSVEFYNDLPNIPEKDPLETQFLDGMLLSRHHIFAVYNKYGDVKKAGSVLDSCLEKRDIEFKQYHGLDAELQFYHAFKTKMNLVPALDCGDNTDFVGNIKGQLVRFDVTTNLSNKADRWKLYSQYKYHLLALWDFQNNHCSFFVADKGQQCKFRKVR